MKKLTQYLQHFFTPQETNNFKAKSLHTDFLTYYLVLSLLLTFTFKFFNSSLHNVLGFATDISVDKLFQLSNQERTNNGLSALTYNAELSAAAQKKAEDMFAKNYWAHFGPNGETPWNFILNAGYKYEYAGENLAKNFMFSNGVVEAWMNSPSHRENILRPEYTDVGYAIVNGVLNGEETTLVVQMFGKPLSPIAQVKNNLTQLTTNNTVPTLAPTTLPSPMPTTAAPIFPASAVLAHETSKPVVNLSTFSLHINLVFLTFIIIALGFDLYFSTRLNLLKLSGKHIAHLIFIGFVIAGIYILTKGSILQGARI